MSTHHGEKKYVKYNAYNLQRVAPTEKFIVRDGKKIAIRFKIKVSKAALPAEYAELNKVESKKRAAAKRAAKRVANGEAPKKVAKKAAAPKKAKASPKPKKAAAPKKAKASPKPKKAATKKTKAAKKSASKKTGGFFSFF